jgi:hypothetical protein
VHRRRPPAPRLTPLRLPPRPVLRVLVEDRTRLRPRHFPAPAPPARWPVVSVGDDTVDGHKGKRGHGKARHRDPVHSSHSYTAQCYGHKWMVPTVLVKVPFAPPRLWALPVLVDLYRSEAAVAGRGLVSVRRVFVRAPAAPARTSTSSLPTRRSSRGGWSGRIAAAGTSIGRLLKDRRGLSARGSCRHRTTSSSHKPRSATATPRRAVQERLGSVGSVRLPWSGNVPHAICMHFATVYPTRECANRLTWPTPYFLEVLPSRVALLRFGVWDSRSMLVGLIGSTALGTEVTTSYRIEFTKITKNGFSAPNVRLVFLGIETLFCRTVNSLWVRCGQHCQI